MKYRTRAIVLLVIQCLLVSSIAGKYLYERNTRPRVWTRAQPYDPNLPMRGRYLSLALLVDTCSLPRGEGHGQNPGGGSPGWWQWRVRTVAKDGKLVVVDAEDALPRSDTQSMWVSAEKPCDSTPLSSPAMFFISDTAKSPLPLAIGKTLWVEVTVPPEGPPRPLQLAISGEGTWEPLGLN
jgi:hypothetical protein